MFMTIPMRMLIEGRSYVDGFSPDSPSLLARLTTALEVQSDPPISLARSGETVITFESGTPPMMVRSRGVQGLEVAAGPDWQNIVREVD